MIGLLRWILGIDSGQPNTGGAWRISFVSEYSSYVKLAMLLALAAMVYLTIRSYRREGNAPRRAKAVLACIRIAVIVLVFLVLLRPALVLRFTEDVYSSVVLLIDDSASMAMKDRYPQNGTDNSPAAIAQLLKTDPAALRQMSRSRIVRDVLLRRSGAVAEIAGEHNVLVMRFAPGDAESGGYVERLKLVPARAKGAWGGEGDDGLPALTAALGSLRAAGSQTDLAAAVLGAMSETAGQRISAIVVITDGQVTVEGAAALVAQARQQAEQRSIPLYAVCVGDTATRHKNLAVTSVRAPSLRVRRGSRVTFSVKLQQSMFADQTVVVSLRRRRSGQQAWQEVAKSEPVKLTGPDTSATRPAGQPPLQGDDGRQLVTINVEGDALGAELGDFIYQAYVQPAKDDVNPDDNAAETPLRICDDKVNVLLVGVAGWEFQFVRDFFLRERRTGPDGKSEEAFRISVWQQDAEAELNQDASTGMKLARLPDSLEQLIGSPEGKPFPGYDMVILCDPMATQDGFDEKFVALLKKFVQEHGGGLCYIAGIRNTEANLIDDPSFAGLAELLPVEVARKIADIAERIRDVRPRAYQVYLTPYGVGHPVMSMGAEGAETAAWNLLPGIYWSHPVRRVKPLAQVLAVNSSPFRRTASDEPEPVLAIQSSGAGRVLYVGFNSTWRWRYLDDAHYFRAFWRDVVKFLAPLKIRQVSIAASRQLYRLTEPVDVEAEAFDEQYEPVTAETYPILVIRTDKPSQAPRKIELRAVDAEGRPGVYTGAVEGLEEGKYRFAPVVPVADERLESASIEVASPRDEARRAEADVTTLQYPTGLASREGNFVRVQAIDRLSGLIPSGRLRFVPEKTYELLDSRRLAALTLAMFVAMLAAEWILRKRFNMT